MISINTCLNFDLCVSLLCLFNAHHFSTNWLHRFHIPCFIIYWWRNSICVVTDTSVLTHRVHFIHFKWSDSIDTFNNKYLIGSHFTHTYDLLLTNRLGVLSLFPNTIETAWKNSVQIAAHIWWLLCGANDNVTTKKIKMQN